MISQIGPLVQAGEKNQRILGAHILGGAIGGLAAGVVVGLAATLLGVVLRTGPTRVELIALSACLAVAGLIDLRLLAPRQVIKRQTPRGWTCSLGPTPGVLAWGVDLGLGLTTRLPAMTFLALPLSCLVLRSFPLSLAVMGTYGVVRAVGIVGVIAVARPKLPMVCQGLAVRASLIRGTVGVAAIAASLLLLSSTQL
jgi:hypothetical protein